MKHNNQTDVLASTATELPATTEASEPTDAPAASRECRTHEKLHLTLSEAIHPDSQEIRLSPWGKVNSTNGEFIVDQHGASLAIDAFQQHGTDIPIDYEHQTLGGAYASPTGRAPAAGWIKAIRCKPDIGLLATVKWTPRARKMLQAGEYRYLSPVAMVRKADRKLVAIHSAALTNKPAIRGMTPIANRRPDHACEPSPATSSQPDATPAPPTKEPESELACARETIDRLLIEQRTRDHEDRIRDALMQGKLLPHQQDWARNLLRTDESLFQQWLGQAPVILQPGRIEPPLPTDSPGDDSAVVLAQKVREFRGNPWLADITTEEAYAKYA